MVGGESSNFTSTIGIIHSILHQTNGFQVQGQVTRMLSFLFSSGIIDSKVLAMASSVTMSFFLCSIVCSLGSLFITYASGNRVLATRVLNVGEELKKQILPLKTGGAVYELQGLKESRWYEVKISYPSSIPASFSLQVKSTAEELWLRRNRRLLDTEKVIFKNSGQSEMYVLVTVEPASIVAKPSVQESKIVLFNIVCDELSFGIPHKAWWVGTAAILCLVLASIIPYFLPLHQWLQSPKSSYFGETKAS